MVHILLAGAYNVVRAFMSAQATPCNSLLSLSDTMSLDISAARMYSDTLEDGEGGEEVDSMKQVSPAATTTGGPEQTFITGCPQHPNRLSYLSSRL